ANMQLVIDTTVAGLRVQQYRRWELAETGLRETLLATFSDVATLRDAEIIYNTSDEREIVVLLYWEPVSQTDVALTGSVQLIGAPNPATGSPLWSQDDHAPQMSRIETTSWAAGAIYRDVYTLDVSAVPAGTYDLVAR